MKAQDLSGWLLDARIGDVLDGNFTHELELFGCP